MPPLFFRSGAAAAVLAISMTSAAAAGAAAAAAAPLKVLHDTLIAAETGFDPATVSDIYSNEVVAAVFEPLYTYDYLARPAKVVPLTAAAMPEIAADGKTYTIHLKKGIHFTPDAAFGGKPRELTMADYVYSWERLLDPKLASQNAWLFEGKITGLDQLATDAARTGKFDYDAKVAGFEIVDRYTLRIHLTRPDFNMDMILAHQPSSALAREVVQKYGNSRGEVAAHPVGTGFYRLDQWVRGSKIVLLENTGHLPTTWNFQAGSDPDDQRIVRQMQGKKMPQIGRIELSVITEAQARWLSFVSGQSDLLDLGGAMAPKALLAGKLRPELAAQGIQLSRLVQPETYWYYWNMSDPVVGGTSKEKIALRRAIAMAYDVQEEINVMQNGQAVKLEFPVPPGVVGQQPDYRSALPYAPVLANKLLDQFGYKAGPDGWRTLPDGKPLLIHYTTPANGAGTIEAELWLRAYDAIHIHMVNDRMQFSDMLKAEKECKLQSRTALWTADYPDGDDFMQLYYGPNTHQNNMGCYQSPAFDRWYEASHNMPAGPARDVLYRDMARQMEVDGAILMGYAPYRNILAQPAVLGYKKHPILLQEWQYFDIDRSLSRK